MVESRSKTVSKQWLAARPRTWQDGVEVVAMDGFTGFKTATAEELPEAIPVLAALLVTNEYRSGQIRTTLLSIPTRIPALVSKATIIAAVSFVIGVVSASIGFAIAPAILAGGGYSSPLDE